MMMMPWEDGFWSSSWILMLEFPDILYFDMVAHSNDNKWQSSQ